MLHNTTNLLPDAKLRSFRRIYFFRIFIFTAYLATLVTVIHAILLFPTHIILSSQVTSRESEVGRLRASSVSSDETTFETRLTNLLKSASRIEMLGQTRSATQIMNDLLTLPHAQVSLSGISYQALGTAKKVSTVTLTGVAGTRDALRAYQVALQASSLVLTADLPVSAYTKETRIPFSITLTLAPQ